MRVCNIRAQRKDHERNSRNATKVVYVYVGGCVVAVWRGEGVDKSEKENRQESSPNTYHYKTLEKNESEGD